MTLMVEKFRRAIALRKHRFARKFEETVMLVHDVNPISILGSDNEIDFSLEIQTDVRGRNVKILTMKNWSLYSLDWWLEKITEFDREGKDYRVYVDHIYNEILYMPEKASAKRIDTECMLEEAIDALLRKWNRLEFFLPKSKATMYDYQSGRPLNKIEFDTVTAESIYSRYAYYKRDVELGQKLAELFNEV